MDSITFQDLSYEYKKLFENLGWMILAWHQGQKDEIKLYEKSVTRFLIVANQKLDTTESYDRKKDLLIMIKNILVLFQYIKEDFKDL